jgi:competence protein ComEA
MFDFQNRAGVIISGALILILVAGAAILAVRLVGHSPQEISLVNTPPPGYTFQVNVEGAVVNPGSYPATTADSIMALVNSAGLKKTADTSIITVRVRDANAPSDPQRVNINTAPAWMLDALPGIGPGRAESIVAYRQKNGPFKGVADLLNVDGMGKSVFDKIKDYITTGD